MKKKYIPTPDDILYGFAVSWDGTPQDLTHWKRQFPLWAPEIEEIATEIVRDAHDESSDLGGMAPPADEEFGEEAE